MVKWFDSLGEYKSDLIVGNPNEPLTRYQPRFLQSALWNVVNETVGEYPHAFITEKTWKAILTKRPFVLLGGIGSLQTLKDQGFKTFDNWIDESYDQQPTFADRCDRALAQIKQFCNLNKKELQQIANQMSEILEHNFNHYINKFGQYKLEILIRDQL